MEGIDDEWDVHAILNLHFDVYDFRIKMRRRLRMEWCYEKMRKMNRRI